MATHKFKTPLIVGDISNRITVDRLELVSISINFQSVLDSVGDLPAHAKFWKDRVIVSCMLRHPDTDWTHTVTLAPFNQKHKEAKAMWERIKTEFPDFEKKILAILAPHLPEGTIS